MLFVYLPLTWFGMDKLPKSTVPANTLWELVNATGKPHVRKHAIDSLVRSKTLVIIAHRLRTIATADQIPVVDGGRVVEQGGHNELASAGGLYSRFWEKQQKARGWKVAGR